MKLLTFRPPRGRASHFGVLLSNGNVLDISALKHGRGTPKTLLDCIQGGAKTLGNIAQAVAAAEQQLAAGRMPAEMIALSDVTLRPPVMPGKIMAVGKNYSDTRAFRRAMSSRPALRPASPPATRARVRGISGTGTCSSARSRGSAS